MNSLTSSTVVGRLQREVQDRHRDVGHRHADRVAGELALELDGSALATALAAPVSVITMFSGAPRPRRFFLWKLSIRFWSLVYEWTVSTWPVDDAELLVHRLEHRHDRVRGAARRRHDAVVGLIMAVVHAVDDVLHVALAGRGEDHLRDALGLAGASQPSRSRHLPVLSITMASLMPYAV
jgi:hypothetical protein